MSMEQLWGTAVEGIAAAGGAACNRGAAVHDEQIPNTIAVEGIAVAGGAACNRGAVFT